MSPADQIMTPVEGKRDFRVKVISNGVTLSYTHRCEGAFTAAQHGMDLCGGDGGRVVVSPVIEMTAGEGVARYPAPLHPKAFLAAWGAWHAERLKDHAAVELQVQLQRSAM